jgi:hypothetical protein
LQDGSYNDGLLRSKWSQLNVEPGIVRERYHWQINNAQYDSWAQKLEEQSNTTGLGYTSQNGKQNQVGRTCELIKDRCNDIKRQNLSEM